MDEPMAEPRHCTVCGDPIRSSNKLGVCSGSGKPACRRERWQLTKKRRRRPGPVTEPRACEVCHRPIRSDNKLGICERHDSPECLRERMRRFREEKLKGNVKRHCEVCGRLLQAGNATGTCDAKIRPACQEERAKWEDGAPPILESWTPPPYIAAGTTFERLTTLEDAHTSKDVVHCLCRCGDNETNETDVRARDLLCGRTRSCGCLRREIHSVHGLYAHPLYRTWVGIVDRCTNPDGKAYENYGGRGISVCERWLDVRCFVADVESEIGPRPEGVGPAGMPLYSLDRTDVEKGYEPGNVQWATQSEQLLNRRKIPELTRERDALAAQVRELTARLKELGG